MALAFLPTPRRGRFHSRAAPEAVQPIVASGRVSPGDQLMGSAKILETDSTGKGDKVRSAEWQRKAWDYYDMVGEAHYAAGFVGSCLSRVSLSIGVRDADGKVGPAWRSPEGDEADPEDPDLRIPIHDLVPEAIATIEALRSPIGGQPQLLRSLGINLTVAGECTLLGTPDEASDGDKWEVLSTDELSTGSGGGLKRSGTGDTGSQAEDVPDNHTAVRIWRPHPRFSKQADSPFKALIDLLEELYLLTRGVRATATSRLAGAGILIVPEDLDYPDTAPAAPESTESSDPFIRDVMRAAVTPITDKGSAAGVVPLMVRATKDQAAAFRHLDFTRNFDAYPSVALRREAVQRFAQGMDLPVEIVTGHANTTFSNAWQIDEATYKAHIEPMLSIIVDALTTGYLWPALMAGNGTTRGFAEISDVVVMFDASELVVHPNRGADAKDLFDRMELSALALRRETGFSEDDAPGEDERARRLEEERAVTPSPDDADPTEDEQGTPPPDLAAAVAAAAAYAIERAVERAGSRLKSKANGKVGTRNTIGDAPNADVARVLGPELVASLATEAELLGDEFGPFGRLVARWCVDAGIEGAMASDVAAECMSVTDKLARERLWGPVRVVPATYMRAIRRVLEG